MSDKNKLLDLTKQLIAASASWVVTIAAIGLINHRNRKDKLKKKINKKG